MQITTQLAKHLTVGVFGDRKLSNRLAKAGTTNDIGIANHKDSEGVFTYVYPNSEKVQSLLQTVNMIDVPVIVADQITKELGEEIIAVDQLGFGKGFILAKVPELVAPLIKGTSVERFEFVEEKDLRSKLAESVPERAQKELEVPIDNYFDVKGVGLVALGIVRSGTLKRHDTVVVEPLGKEALVKGLQSQDDFVEQASAGTRLGINLRGIEKDELRRGYVLCSPGTFEKSSELAIDFKKNRFFKQELREGMSVLVSIGLQVVTFQVESLSGTTLKLKTDSDHQVAYKKGRTCIVAFNGESFPRIVGSGPIV